VLLATQHFESWVYFHLQAKGQKPNVLGRLDEIWD